MQSLFRACLGWAMVVAVAACSATDKAVPQPDPVKRAPQGEAARKRKPPCPRHCGEVLDPRVWKVQCSDGGLAMTCRKSDPTDRRCAARDGGRLRWTYGSYCARALPCYRRACPP